jgi:hypothetical protein
MAQPVVAVVNTNPDLVELLKARIEAAGFVVLVIHIAEIRAVWILARSSRSTIRKSSCMTLSRHTSGIGGSFNTCGKQRSMDGSLCSRRRTRRP